MTMLTLIKKKHLIGLAYSFGGLVQHHGSIGWQCAGIGGTRKRA